MRKDSVGVIFLTGVKGWFCQMWDDFAQNCFSNEWICTKLSFQMSVFAHKCILFSGVCCAHISTLVIAEENVTNLVQKICYDKKSCRAVRKQAKMWQICSSVLPNCATVFCSSWVALPLKMTTHCIKSDDDEDHEYESWLQQWQSFRIHIRCWFVHC